jgi:hypothetical protein
MRNSILALVTVGSLTFAAPAFAAGPCYPCLDSSPIHGAFDSSPARGLSYQMRGESYQVPAAHTRHARRYHSSYRYTG